MFDNNLFSTQGILYPSLFMLKQKFPLRVIFMQDDFPRQFGKIPDSYLFKIVF